VCFDWWVGDELGSGLLWRSEASGDKGGNFLSLRWERESEREEEGEEALFVCFVLALVLGGGAGAGGLNFYLFI